MGPENKPHLEFIYKRQESGVVFCSKKAINYSLLVMAQLIFLFIWENNQIKATAIAITFDISIYNNKNKLHVIWKWEINNWKSNSLWSYNKSSTRLWEYIQIYHRLHKKYMKRGMILLRHLVQWKSVIYQIGILKRNSVQLQILN